MITNNIFTAFAIGKLVGGCYPHNSLDVPYSVEELMQLLDSFKDPKADYKEVSEAKIGTFFVRELLKDKVQYCNHASNHRLRT